MDPGVILADDQKANKPAISLEKVACGECGTLLSRQGDLDVSSLRPLSPGRPILTSSATSELGIVSSPDVPLDPC